MANDGNPLLKALPPAVDYLSYLTILEYNLTLEHLPLLHDILQDKTLTANIGWDLVHLLCPLLPQSQTCLQDVARLGNPREVVLKVTELLEGLAIADEATTDEEEDEQEDGQDQQHQIGTYEKTQDDRPNDHPDEKAAAFDKQDTADASGQAENSTPRQRPSKVLQFSALVDMLAVLHPRIQTKYPSRFLSTSLQAALPAYAALALETDATDAVLRLINTFAGTKRPRLPPRSSSTQVPTKSVPLPPAAPDPEATEESLAPEETALKEKLLQSFLTFVAEGYMSSLPINEDTPALSWSTRLLERLHPDKVVPGKKTVREAFEQDDAPHSRDSTIGQMLALTKDLDLTFDHLRCALVEPDTPANDDSTDLPASASEVPLSRKGCLYLLCASYASAALFDARGSQNPSASTFFSLLGEFLGDPSSSTLGSESLPLIDSLIFFGHYTLQSNDMNSFLERPENDSIFTKTLQYFSIISANTPSAALRYAAHLLTSNILHKHPNDHLRLTFIKDTLQHCPYENLKASAVGWLKDEILAANKEELSSVTGQSSAKAQNEQTVPSIFATPTCIATLAPHLFVSPINMDKDEFHANENFFLAALNLYYLLLSKEGLKENLGLSTAGGQLEDINGTGGWLDSLQKTLRKFEDETAEEEDRGMERGGQMNLLEGMIAMCREKEL
ncbi:MAG: hypothetical protein Q9169_001382 [Polycauliona sp. 2 TL-2023]